MPAQRREIFYYGSVGLTRVICPKCKSWCIVQKGRTPCCKIQIEFDDSKPRSTRSTTPPQKRRPLTEFRKRKIIRDQGYKCIYCLQEFGSTHTRDGHESVTLSVEFDHLVPYSYSQDNSLRNMVAACQVDNGLKHNFHYKDLEQAREHLRQARKDKGYDF